MADGGMEAVYVFMSMVVLADQDGAVRIDGRVLANRIGIPYTKLKPALAILQTIDPSSNIKDEEGKRIIPLSDVEHLEGNRGYWLVNYEHYRDKGTRNDQKEKATQRKRRQRERDSLAKTVTDATETRDVSLGGHGKTAHIDIDTDIDTDLRGAAAPEKTRLWDIARGWLGGTLLGKTLRDASDDERVKQAILDTLAKDPADPKTFFLGCMKETNGKARKSTTGRLSAVEATEAGIERYLARKTTP